jgi:hypothetical protein
LKRLKSHTVVAAKAEKKTKNRKNANSVSDKGEVSKASADENEKESTAEVSFSTEQSSVNPSSAAVTADKVSEDVEPKALDFTVIGRDRFKKVKRVWLILLHYFLILNKYFKIHFYSLKLHFQSGWQNQRLFLLIWDRKL